MTYTQLTHQDAMLMIGIGNTNIYIQTEDGKNNLLQLSTLNWQPENPEYYTYFILNY